MVACLLSCFCVWEIIISDIITLCQETVFKVESLFPEHSQIIHYLQKVPPVVMAPLLFWFSLAYSSISLWCSVISTSMKVTDSLPSCKRHSYRWGLQDSHRCLNIFRIFRLTLQIPKKMSIFFLKMFNCLQLPQVLVCTVPSPFFLLLYLDRLVMVGC